VQAERRATERVTAPRRLCWGTQTASRAGGVQRPTVPFSPLPALATQRPLSHPRSVEALNTSKPLREAVGDVEDACAAFRYCARQAEALETRLAAAPTEALPAPEFAGRIRYEPVGVVAAICPWNL
jgi:hypothetical protein